MKTVTVQFQSVNGMFQGKTYDYKCAIPGIATGDMCVVSVLREGVEVFCVVKVAGVHKQESPRATKYVICKVDFDQYSRAIELEEERIRLKSQLDARIRMLNEQEYYQRFAEADPEARTLLDKLHSLEEKEV